MNPIFSYKTIIPTHFLSGIFGGDGLMGLGRTALPSIESVTVENENIVQVDFCD